MIDYHINLVRSAPETRFFRKHVLRRKTRIVTVFSASPKAMRMERSLNKADVAEFTLRDSAQFLALLDADESAGLDDDAVVDETFTDDFGTTLHKIHVPADCADRPHCLIHRPSDHHMREWRLLWRDDRRIFERICEHGIGHPDPDDLAFHVSQGREHEGVHGCDGCCYPPETDARAKLMADLQEYGP